MVIFAILLLMIFALTAIIILIYLKLSMIEANLGSSTSCIDSEIKTLMSFVKNISSESDEYLLNESQDNCITSLIKTLLKLYEDNQIVNMLVESLNYSIENVSIYLLSLSKSVMSSISNSSCLEIGKKLYVFYPSGFYIVRCAGVVYCDLNRTFGSNATG